MSQLHIYPDGPAVAKAFADYLTAKIEQHTGDFHLALSGGSTPKLLFKLLADEYADRIEWAKLHLYWGDERMVPHNDPESNYGEVRTLLLDCVDIPENNIHPVPTAIAPADAAKAYEMVIRHSLPTAHLPAFDLVMLGMGDDGHTASIFPHQMELLEDQSLCGVATHPVSGQKRVTLNGPLLNAAKEVAFLVTGAKKTDRVAQILNKEAAWKTFPAAHIQPVNGTLHWWLDDKAAEKIN